MALPYPSNSVQPEGLLEVEQISDNLYRGYFTPPIEALSGIDKDVARYRRNIIEVDCSAKTIKIVPFRVWSFPSMSNRYVKLTEICFDLPPYAKHYLNADLDMQSLLFSSIPEVFTRDINYGFGFKRHYGQVANILDQLGVKKLVVTSREKTSIDVSSHLAIINASDMEGFRRVVDNIVRRSQVLTSTMKRDALQEALFTALGSDSFTSFNNGKISKEEFAKLIGKTNRFMEGGASLAEQNDALTVIRKNAKKITQQQPRELIKLKNDLDLVNLEQLIQKFQEMMVKKLKEFHWQLLFQQNPFIINMAFGIPVLSVQGQASVGGHRISGGGGKIADFLVKNSLSNNTAIVEIKTPAMNLVQPRSYRTGVHGPSQELSSAVSQVLDQVYLLQKDINSIKVNSRLFDIESYHIHGILIAGTAPTEADEHKSFEYFRGNSKNVQILTFDELLEKLKSLHRFLLPPPPVVSDTENDDDLPF
jgi:Domain of unknown function (DUF4263)